MAEQHYKETKAAKQAKSIGEYDSGYRFDLALCRKIFDEYDQDESGYLDIQELTELAEVLFQNAVCIYFFHFIALSPSVFCRRLRYTFSFTGLDNDVTHDDCHSFGRCYGTPFIPKVPSFLLLARRWTLCFPHCSPNANFVNSLIRNRPDIS